MDEPASRREAAQIRQETVAVRTSGRSSNPLDMDIVLAGLTQEASPQGAIGQDGRGIRSDDSVQWEPVPGGKRFEQHRQRAGLSRRRTKPCLEHRARVR